MTFDINGDKKPKSYTIHAMESAEIPKPVAHRMAVKIAKRLFFKRGQKTNYQNDMKTILTTEIYLSEDDYEAGVHRGF